MKPIAAIQSHGSNKPEPGKPELSKIEKEINMFKALLQKADKADANAQHDVGRCYKKGTGVEVDKKKALEYFEKSAKQNNRAGQTSVGIYYLEEATAKIKLSADKKEVDELFQKGISYLLLAAEQQGSVAENHLGDCYSNGKGVAVDLQKAKEYYQSAILHGDKDAPKNLKGLEEHLAKCVLAKPASTTLELPATTVTVVPPLAVVVSTVPATATFKTEVKDIKISIRSMIEELKTYIANTERVMQGTGYLKSLAKSVLTVGGYLPSSRLSKMVGGNIELKIKHSKAIQAKLAKLVIQDNDTKAIADRTTATAGVASASAGTAIVTSSASSLIAISKDIPGDFGKILHEFALLDAAAGGGKEISGIIKNYECELNQFNEELKKTQQAAQAAPTATLPPLVASVTNK